MDWKLKLPFNIIEEAVKIIRLAADGFAILLHPTNVCENRHGIGPSFRVDGAA